MAKQMSSVLCAAVVVLLISPALAQSKAPLTTDAQLRVLLNEFLDAAGRNDKAMHQRFWADDVIYTSAKGVVRTKADIMKALDQPQEAKAPNTTFSAEDVRINDQGDWAVVNFRLVGKTEQDGQTSIANYRNTGTFRRRNGQWQVVAWQATKIDEPSGK
jgi:ketosteroid isomerase-like protein